MHQKQGQFTQSQFIAILSALNLALMNELKTF